MLIYYRFWSKRPMGMRLEAGSQSKIKGHRFAIKADYVWAECKQWPLQGPFYNDFLTTVFLPHTTHQLPCLLDQKQNTHEHFLILFTPTLKMEAAHTSETLATLTTVTQCKGPRVQSTMNHYNSLNSLITLRKSNAYKIQDISG